jgi:hypothetical protein
MIDIILNFLKSLLAALNETKPADVIPIRPDISQPKTAGEIVKQEKGLNWYPKAHKLDVRMRNRGKYAKGYPLGAVVHFTSGHSGGLKKAISSIEGGMKNGFTFVVIADTGELVQAHRITEWGYHCGESKLTKNLPKGIKALVGSCSDDLLGIEMNNAGRVEKVGENKFKTWFGTYLTKDQVRYTEGKEKTLIDFLVWLKVNDPVGCFDFEYVRGHDEISGKLELGYWRKNDPGASLSMTMPELRKRLQDEYSKISKL